MEIIHSKNCSYRKKNYSIKYSFKKLDNYSFKKIIHFFEKFVIAQGYQWILVIFVNGPAWLTWLESITNQGFIVAGHVSRRIWLFSHRILAFKPIPLGNMAELDSWAQLHFWSKIVWLYCSWLYSQNFLTIWPSGYLVVLAVKSGYIALQFWLYNKELYNLIF